MLSKCTKRVLANFTRLVKPHIHKYENVFDIMKDRPSQIPAIERYNERIFSTTKDTPYEEIL